jgi:hypothetical protein
LVSIGSVISAAGVASRLPGRAINGPLTNSRPPRASTGRSAGAAISSPLPQAGPDNQTQLIDALSRRVVELERRLAAMEGVLQVTPGGSVTLSSVANLTIEATTVRVNASTVTLDSGMTSASGVLRSETLITDSVIAASYSPGAGNLW